MTRYITWQGLYSCSYLTCWTLRNLFYCKCVLCRKIVIAILCGETKDLVHRGAWAVEIDNRRKEDLNGSLSLIEINMKFWISLIISLCFNVGQNVKGYTHCLTMFYIWIISPLCCLDLMLQHSTEVLATYCSVTYTRIHPTLPAFSITWPKVNLDYVLLFTHVDFRVEYLLYFSISDLSFMYSLQW